MDEIKEEFTNMQFPWAQALEWEQFTLIYRIKDSVKNSENVNEQVDEKDLRVQSSNCYDYNNQDKDKILLKSAYNNDNFSSQRFR